MNPSANSKTGVLRRIDWLLRGKSKLAGLSTIRQTTAILLVAGCWYGAVMGTFGGLSYWRLPQIIYSSVKVPLLLFLTFVLSLPSFFVLNSLLGLRGDVRQAIRSVAGAQASLILILASLAPFTGLWYISGADYHSAILFNAGTFAVASVGAQLVLRRSYRPLIQRN